MNLNTNEDNILIPVTEIKYSMLTKFAIGNEKKCNGCGSDNPKFFNVRWQLYVCGKETCKQYDIMQEWAHHAMTGE